MVVMTETKREANDDEGLMFCKKRCWQEEEGKKEMTNQYTALGQENVRIWKVVGLVDFHMHETCMI